MCRSSGFIMSHLHASKFASTSGCEPTRHTSPARRRTPRAIIHNVHLVDGGQQFIKASPGSGTVDEVEVSCSQFVMTAEGRDNVWGYGDPSGRTSCYTGGIDTHDSRDWHIHDSYFEGIYCDPTGARPAHGKKSGDRGDMTYSGGLAEHAIHMWNSEDGTGHLIERNQIVNCARGIGLGLTATVYGSRIVNNMILSEHSASPEHDVGIIVERAVDTLVAHNTVFFSHANSHQNSIEYRWDSTSELNIFGNLTNRPIKGRNDASATLTDNMTDAIEAFFSSVDSGDLHLSSCEAATVVASLDDVSEDFDGENRGTMPQAGADQCSER